MEKIKNHIKTLHSNKPVKTILAILLFLIIVLTAFQAGIFVGYQKAKFSNRLGDKYYKQTYGDDRRGDRMMGLFNKDLPGGNGAAGKIVSINDSGVVVATPDNVEKTILINNDTLIRRFREEISIKDLVVGDQIIVLGTPNDKAEVQAKLIRLLPPAPQDSTTLQASSTPR